jgi:hypothetical protein
MRFVPKSWPKFMDVPPKWPGVVLEALEYELDRRQFAKTQVILSTVATPDNIADAAEVARIRHCATGWVFISRRKLWGCERMSVSSATGLRQLIDAVSRARKRGRRAGGHGLPRRHS